MREFCECRWQDGRARLFFKMIRRVLKWCSCLSLAGFLLLGGCVASVAWTMPRGGMREAKENVERLIGDQTAFLKQEGAVNYLQMGEGKNHEVTFFFVHGTPGELGNWGIFLGDDELQEDYGMIAFDRLGHGQSQRGVAEVNLQKQAEALAKVASGIAGKKIWVGHSYGAGVVSKVAALQPDLVDGLVLVAGSMSGELVQKTWYQSLGETRLAQSLMNERWKVANLEMVALEGELNAMSDAWGDLTCPVVVVHAKNDILAKFANVAFVEERIDEKRFRKVVLEDENHFLIWNSVPVVKKVLFEMAEDVKEGT